jgi:RHS repeat-associated protein
LEEWAVEGSTATLTCYTLGDDVIAQKKTYWQWVDPQWELQSTGNTQYLLYDGHGSTRQLAEYNTEVTIADSFSYDAYGVLLQNESVASANPGKVAQQATSMLYAGEHFDTDSQNYYLRARWYDSLSGRFNRIDPFAGNNKDPQSLHKYLYAHCNPINRIDPAGEMAGFTGVGQLVVNSIKSSLRAISNLCFVEKIRWTANALVAGLVGWDFYQGLKDGSAMLDAGTIGFGVSIGHIKAPIGGAINPEIVIGTGSKNNWGLFVGGGPTTNNTVSAAGYIGIAFNTPTSENYKGLCRSVNISFNLLPLKWRKLIKEEVETFLPRLHQGFMQRGSDIGEIARSISPELVSQSSKILTQALSKGMSGSSVTFWGGQGSNAFGITFSPGLISSPNSRNLSVSYQNYWPLWPQKETSFRE